MDIPVLLAIAMGLLVFAGFQVRRYRDIFHPVCMQSLMVALLIGVRILYILGGHDDNLPITMMEDPAAGLLRAVLFYLGFFALAIVAYKASKLILPKNRPFFFAVRDYGALKLSPTLLAILYVAVGIASLSFIANRVGIDTFLSDVVSARAIFTGNWSLMYGLTTPFIGASIWYAMILRGDSRLSTKILFAASFAIGVGCMLLTGFRGYFFMMLISFLALRANVHKKGIDYTRLALFVLAVALIFPVMDGLVYGGLWTNITDGDFSAVGRYYTEHCAQLFSYAYGRYYTLEGTARTLLFLDNQAVPFDDGRLLWAFPRILLPTAWVGWKPSVTQEIARFFFSDRYGLLTETSAVTSLPAFMYWQAGWTGFVTAAVAYGLFMRYWVGIYEAGGLGNAVFIAATYPYFLMIFTGHIGTLAMFIHLHIILLPLLRFTRLREPARSGSVECSPAPGQLAIQSL